MTRPALQRIHARLLAWVIASLLLIPGRATTQGPNSLRGRVRDENRRPVSFAQVQLEPGDRRVVADESGEFVIAAIPDGEYQLRVRRIGFEPTRVSVRVPFDELSSGGVASREDLDAYADMDLCQALMRTPLGGKMKLRETSCSQPACIIVDGLQPLVRPLNAFLASEVEAFEHHEKDWTGTIA